VLACFTFGGLPAAAEVRNTVSDTTIPITFLGIIGALQSIFYTYDGWHTATYFSEENTDPAKTLPKSMMLGVLGIIIIYLAVNAAILYVVPMEQLVHSKLAAADAISIIFGAESSKWITIFLMISILGIVNAQIMFAPRVIFSMSRDGLFFKGGSKVNANGTPSLAMPLTGFLAILLILQGKETCGILSDIATFFFVLSYAAGFAALIRLRYKEPELNRPFKAPFFPYLPAGLLLMSVMFLVGAFLADRGSSIYAIGFLAISYPLFILVKKLNSSGES
jgi:APA family basic amino acid/polyamine antiporter